jgi:hemerythrin-like metal-binding protein
VTITIPLQWDESFVTGIAKIDEQHKILVDTLNEANARLGDIPNPELLGEITRNLLSYALYHFETEEALMQANDYAATCPEDSARHHREHRDFSQTVVNLRKGIQAGQLVDRQTLITFLSEWLVNHILHTDKKLGAWLAEHRTG